MGLIASTAQRVHFEGPTNFQVAIKDRGSSFTT